VHNRLSCQHQHGGWQYNADNQLLGYGVGSEQITLSYSTNGHTTREVTGNPAAPLKVRDYRYNAAERLTEIDDNGQAIGRYRYDPMGRRVYKETATETTWFIYADEGLIAELRADGTLKRGYGWKPQGLWGTDPLWLADKTAAGASDWSTHVYHNDHLWTPQRLTDSAGVVSWSGRSEAFGLTQATVNTVDNPLRFPGQYWDSESDQNQNYFRDYRPTEGRYLQSDPIDIAGGVNFYVYSWSNPLGAFDRFGLEGECYSLKIERAHNAEIEIKSKEGNCPPESLLRNPKRLEGHVITKGCAKGQCSLTRRGINETRNFGEDRRLEYW
jgi:RHS repeat-associated protein